MKRLQPVVLTALILAANSVQAQTNTQPYRPDSASVYSDIVGEFEPSDDWIVQPEKKPSSFSKTSSSNVTPPVGPSIENVEIFGSQPPVQQPLPAWRRTESAQLWNTPERRNTEYWREGTLRLQLGIDYLFYSRGAAADDFFAFNDAGDTFSLGDIDPGSDTTARYRVLIADNGGTGFELTGYDFEQFSGSLTLEGEGITPIFFGGIPAEPAESYTASYESSLTNFEANIWARRSERFRIGYGLRYIELDEQFDIEFIDDPNSSNPTPTPFPGAGTTMSEDGFFSSTENRIFGGQLMARLYRPVINGFDLEAGVDAGYGSNRIKTESRTANVDSDTELDTSTGFFNFIGGVVYRPMDGLTFRAGYEGLLLTSVALGPDQSTAINGINQTGGIQTGSLYFSGAYFGGTIAF